jgi:hypothetical protein
MRFVSETPHTSLAGSVADGALGVSAPGACELGELVLCLRRA